MFFRSVSNPVRMTKQRMDECSSWQPQQSDCEHDDDVCIPLSAVKAESSLFSETRPDKWQRKNCEIFDQQCTVDGEGMGFEEGQVQNCEMCEKQCVMCSLQQAQRAMQVALEEMSKSEGSSQFCSCSLHRHLNKPKYCHTGEVT